MSRGPSRRSVLAALAGAPVALAAPRALGQATAKVVVVGGGFAGATAARQLARAGLRTTLVEPMATYTACPLSNEVLAGLRTLEQQRFDYGAIRSDGVEIAAQSSTAVDAARRLVTLGDGSSLPYDRLVLAPGVDLRFNALPGYDEAAADLMPHAWKAGPQTDLLRRQLEAMENGGTVAIAVPANPYRCPPGPYERASLVAHYLKARKPRSKVLILDSKDAFSKQSLFQQAWAALYPGMIEWIGLSAGGKVTEVRPAARTLVTEFGAHRVDVANVIPPQQAGRLAREAGASDRTGWCPVQPATFESTLLPGVHVIGDAAIMGAMPKSAFAANAQAKACVAAIAAILGGREPQEPKLINTCYSLVAPDYGISVAGVYRPAGGVLAEVPGAGGVSPLTAPRETRRTEARYAEAWFRTITAETFGRSGP
jgi:NADPH-dependent 2,4-dienoyl-CoA reductase/sulfur reductase-like enzyme